MGVAGDASMTGHRNEVFQNTEDTVPNTVCCETHKYGVILHTLAHTAEDLKFIIDKICINLIGLYEIRTYRIIVYSQLEF